MSIHLNKPPIVEAWIGFTVSLAPDMANWSDRDVFAQAIQFLEDHVAEFPEQEMLRQESFTIEKRAAEGMPKQGRLESRVSLMRAIDREKSHAIQIAADVFSYHLLRAGDSYPGFTKLRDASLEKLQSYAERFQPQELTQIELHMIDVVAIPRRPDTNCRIEDYFAISVEIPPDPFGTLDDFSIQLQLRGATPEDRLHLHFHLLRAGSNLNEFRFRIKWDMACPVKLSLADKEQISARLDSAYKHLFACFQSMFTPQGWQLFEPVETVPPCT